MGEALALRLKVSVGGKGCRARTLRPKLYPRLRTPGQLARTCDEHRSLLASPSGSFQTMGMVIIPCSIRTMSEIASGVTSNLLTRAADVVLKERRRLVLVVRETPLHALPLRTMAGLAEAGAIIAPPVPGFYARPKSVDDIVNHTVGRVLDLFGIEAGVVKRWKGAQAVMSARTAQSEEPK